VRNLRAESQLKGKRVDFCGKNRQKEDTGTAFLLAIHEHIGITSDWDTLASTYIVASNLMIYFIV
jgi:hypothetical protein